MNWHIIMYRYIHTSRNPKMAATAAVSTQTSRKQEPWYIYHGETRRIKTIKFRSGLGPWLIRTIDFSFGPECPFSRFPERWLGCIWLLNKVTMECIIFQTFRWVPKSQVFHALSRWNHKFFAHFSRWNHACVFSRKFQKNQICVWKLHFPRHSRTF